MNGLGFAAFTWHILQFADSPYANTGPNDQHDFCWSTFAKACCLERIKKRALQEGPNGRGLRGSLFAGLSFRRGYPFPLQASRVG